MPSKHKLSVVEDTCGTLSVRVQNVCAEGRGLKPHVKQSILASRPQVAPAEIEEYERLLSQRFAADPDLPKSPDAAADEARREDRLKELYQKLFASP